MALTVCMELVNYWSITSYIEEYSWVIFNKLSEEEIEEEEASKSVLKKCLFNKDFFKI